MFQKSSKILYVFIFLAFQAFCQQNAKLVYSEGLAPRIKESKDGNSFYGFVNESGKFEIKPEYDSVASGFSGGYAVTYKKSKVGVIDKKGETIIPFLFAEISVPFANNIVPVKDEKGLWGFYTVKGKQITSCLYNNFRVKDKGKIVVQKDGLWGVIDYKGTNILKHQYKELDISPDNKFYKAIRYNSYEFRDTTNKASRDYSFDSLQPAGEGVLKYYMLGKYGLIDIDGEFITHYKYDSIGTNQFDSYVVKIWDKYGVVNFRGEEFVPVIYEKVIVNEHGVRIAVKNKEGKLWWGLLDEDGNKLINPGYPYLGEPGDGLIPAKAENGLWRYIDFSGNTKISFKFTKAGAFKDGVAEVVDYISDSTVLIDKTGKVLITAKEFPFYKAGLLWMDRYNTKIWKITRNNYDDLELINDKYIRAKKAGKFGLLTVDDHLIISCKYDYVSEPSPDGYILVQLGKKWGIIDDKGRYTLQLTERFERIFPFQEGYAKMMVKGRYGFIDPRGNIYVSPQYADAGHASNNMIAVQINNKWGFIDTDEKLVVQPYYAGVWPFKKGVAVTYLNKKYSLINKLGKELHDPVDNIKITTTGKYLLIKNGRYGLYDAAGKEILPIKYDIIREVKGGYLIVNLRGLYGVLNTENNIVIPITYNFINYDPFNKLFICGSNKGFEQISIDGNGKKE